MTSPFDTVNRNETVISLAESTIGASQAYRIVYANALYCIFMFLVPLGALLLLNAELIREVTRARRRRRVLLGERLPRHHGHRAFRAGSISGGEDDITLTLVVVVVVFVVCQTPALATQILINVYSKEDRECPTPFFFYERLSDLLVVFNSAINFVIYCFCSRRFRQAFKCLFFNRRRSASGASLGAGIIVRIEGASDCGVLNGGDRQIRSRSVCSSLSPDLNNRAHQLRTRSLTDDVVANETFL